MDSRRQTRGSVALRSPPPPRQKHTWQAERLQNVSAPSSTDEFKTTTLANLSSSSESSASISPVCVVTSCAQDSPGQLCKMDPIRSMMVASDEFQGPARRVVEQSNNPSAVRRSSCDKGSIGTSTPPMHACNVSPILKGVLSASMRRQSKKMQSFEPSSGRVRRSVIRGLQTLSVGEDGCALMNTKAEAVQQITSTSSSSATHNQANCHCPSNEQLLVGAVHMEASGSACNDRRLHKTISPSSAARMGNRSPLSTGTSSLDTSDSDDSAIEWRQQSHNDSSSCSTPIMSEERAMRILRRPLGECVETFGF